MGQSNKKISGKITQVLGAVVDVYFPMEGLPFIETALKTTNKFISDKKNNLTLEVAQHLGDNVADYKRVRRGWYLGDEAFRKELLGQMKERMGEEHYGEERQETAEALAEVIVTEELKRRRWREEDLGRRAKGDAVKVALAVRVRTETVMTVKWIAERLQMGSPGYVNLLLYHRRKADRNG